MSDGQNSTVANRYVIQLGGDVMTWEPAYAGKAAVGVVGGYDRQHSSTHNSLTSHDAKGNVNGYSAALYRTWYQSLSDQSSMYIDSWLQYTWFNNEVKGEDLSLESYKSHRLSASL